jgi:beta-glucosidase
MKKDMMNELEVSRAYADELLSRMTLAEKAGQMAQVEKNSITPAEVAQYGIGSVLSGGGGNPDPNTAKSWLSMVSSYIEGSRQSRLGVPALYGTDAVHGHNNVKGATIFPHNIGLGATGDAELVEGVYRAAAIETTATGARWMFAPTLAVGIDPRWGRTYEAFGDHAALVSELGAAAVRGVTGQRLDRPDSALSCIKHFVGDGGTAWGSVKQIEWLDFWDDWGDRWKIDQGDTEVDSETLRRIHIHPYLDGIAAGALSAMASYSSLNGEKMHSHREMLTDVLKGELGFEGFVVSDWLGLDQLNEDPYRQVVIGISAGIDMVMVPFDFRRLIDNVVSAVQAGDLETARVDDAVRRILTVKHAMGLFDSESDFGPSVDLVGCSEHRALARRAAAASAVLLADSGGVLPIRSGPVLVAGAGADDMGRLCGGWTIEWQGSVGPITSGTTILSGLDKSDLELEVIYDVDGSMAERVQAPVGVVVVSELPYAEGHGDLDDLGLPEADVQLIERVRPHVEKLVLVLVSGRPLVLEAVIDHCDAIVVAWLPGSEAAGIVDVLTGVVPFSGRLPRRWPMTAEHVASPLGGWATIWDRGHGASIHSE